MNNEFNFGNFVWFMGEVVDVMDPNELGRVRVKIFGKHTSENDIDVNALPWAIVASPTSSASTSEVGTLPHALLVGSQIVGFYLDNHTAQVPMVLFSFPAKTDDKKDVSELARSNNTIKNSKIGYEPDSPYKAKYPHNKVTVTQSGHIIEIDDTQDGERIHVRHKTGSYYYIFPNGDMVRKSVKDDYEIVVGNESIWVGGNVKEYIKGNYTLEVGGSFNIKVGGSYSVNVGGSTTIKTSGSFTNSCGGSGKYSSGGQTKITGSVIALN